MMVSEKEAKTIRKFVCGQLRDEPNLSTLTLGILKRRYLAHVRCESLGPEARNIMKQVVAEELMKMQDNDENGSELETSKKPQNKRKREKERDEVISGKEDDDDDDDDEEEEEESTAKKSRRQSNSSSESADEDDCKTGSESEEEEKIKSESEDAEQEVKKSQRKTNANGKQQISSEDSTDEEINKSEENDKNESNCEDSPKEVMKGANGTKNGEKRSCSTSQGKKTPQSDEENDTDTDSKSEKSDKINGNDSDDGEKEEKVSVEHKNNDLDLDSSSIPSLEDEQHSGEKKTQDDKKKKATKKEEKKEKSARSQKDDDKAVVRLKRYISLCGVRLKYKKLLDGCRSVRSQVAVLKKELEDLGIHGQPSIMKCKKVRMKREESQELAELDVSNIIATKGRPKRRGASAWQEQHDPPSSTYLRSLNSGSDSDEENNTHRGRRRATDWANLQGIISDDADSN